MDLFGRQMCVGIYTSEWWCMFAPKWWYFVCARLFMQEGEHNFKNVHFNPKDLTKEPKLSQNMQIVATSTPTSWWCHHCVYMWIKLNIVDYIKVGTHVQYKTFFHLCKT
jgi:hypothetical protein